MSSAIVSPSESKPVDGSRSVSSRRLGLLIPLPFVALMLYASVAGRVAADWFLRDILVVGAIDWLLIFGLQQGARWLRSIHWILSPLASLGLGLVIAFTVQCDAGWLPGKKNLLLLVFGLALVHQVLLWMMTPGQLERGPARRVLVSGLLALLGFASLAAFAAKTDPTVRWHLYWHQHAVGLPLYTFLSNSIDEEHAALMSTHGRLVDAADVVGAVTPPQLTSREGAGDVVFVLVDTWRADTLEANGGDASLMPRLNALAKQGTVLTNLHANASWTRASCATIFTGLLPEEVGATSFADSLPEAWTTLPEIFQGAGYATAAFVTNWIQVGIKTGFGQGFDHFHELRSFDEVEELMAQGNAHIRELYARAEEVNEELFNWLDTRPEDGGLDQPLFLYVHYLDPHSPYLAGVEEGTPADSQARKRSGYRQEVRYTDEHLGALVEGLRERLGPDVTFIITSDHGEEFWEHGNWGHGHSLYREQVWVPLVVLQGSADGQSTEAGAILDDALESRDLFDMSVALAEDDALDLGAWAAARARSQRYASQYLSQAIDAPLPEQRKTVMRRLDQGDEVLIWSAYGPTVEVYDLNQDPLETSNLVGRDRQRDRILKAAMDGALRFWVRTTPVRRTSQELELLNKLGYAEASAVTTVQRDNAAK